jgi:hypothetical protein
MDVQKRYRVDKIRAYLRSIKARSYKLAYYYGNLWDVKQKEKKRERVVFRGTIYSMLTVTALLPVCSFF